jgi:predicted flap endonuclease-1-like 5' DNA nuclease
MSEAFTTAIILLTTFLLFTHYIQKGLGGMSAPLRQFGMFLLTKAAGPATDMFQEKEGSGAKTWMQTGVFWLVLAGIGGFLSAWHNYDPSGLDSLSNIGWGYDDGSALAYFNEVAMTTAIFAILLGGALVAHSRTTGSPLASEANASMIAMAWTAQALLGLVLCTLDHWDWITYGATQMALYGLVSALLVMSLLVNSLITLGNRGRSPVSVPSWFMLLGLLALLFSRVGTAFGELLGWTGTVWVADIMASGWVPLALMFAVGYHVLSHVTGQPIWSGSLTKGSMFLLFITIPPFFLAESSHADSFTQSIGAILVTLGLFPVFAAATNMVATIRGNAGAVIDSPGATAAAAGALLLPLFALLGYFTGLNVMVGDGSMANAAETVNSSFLYVIGGLFALAALFHSYPLVAGKSLTGSAGAASWLLIAGGLLSTVLFLMSDWSENALVEAGVEDTSTGLSGFALTGAFAFYGVVIGFIIAGNCVVKTLLFGNVQAASTGNASDISVYNMVEGTTSIRELFGRGVGVDTTLVIGKSEEDAVGGSTVITVSSVLHNDEVDEFPMNFDEDLVTLTKWLCGRGTTTAQFFAWADVDDSGEIDLFEFSNALSVADIADLPPWDIEKIVGVMDINSDGKINLPELDIALLNIRNKLGIEFIPYEDEVVEEAEAEEVDESEEEEEESVEESEESEEESESAEAPSEAELKKRDELERVKANASKIDFDVLGTAEASDKDDLQAIKGVGPFIEEKLNTLGIYTYEQMSKMTSELEDTVNEAIEFFPGRVKRDQWVAQSKTLLDGGVWVDEGSNKSNLKKMKKAELVDVAKSMGLSHTGTKADLVERITQA